MADKKMPNLKAKYQAEVAPALMQKFGYKSVMQIPKLDKIVVNCGCGEARENSKVLEAVVGDLTKITGQKAIITKAKKSVANFKLREEMPIGAKVTLRGDRMWEFLPRDRVRQDRQDPGHGRCALHHRQHRRRGPGAADAHRRSLRRPGVRREYHGEKVYDPQAAAGTQVLFPPL